MKKLNILLSLKPYYQDVIFYFNILLTLYVIMCPESVGAWFGKATAGFELAYKALIK